MFFVLLITGSVVGSLLQEFSAATAATATGAGATAAAGAWADDCAGLVEHLVLPGADSISSSVPDSLESAPAQGPRVLMERGRGECSHHLDWSPCGREGRGGGLEGCPTKTGFSGV
jgi:hypothetical protein